MILSVLLLILPYQNCSKVTNSQTQSSQFKGGEGVDGKTYRSYASCPTGVAVGSLLKVSNAGTTATLTRDNCQDLASPVNVPIMAIQFAAGNAKTLLYNGKIFDQQAGAQPQAITLSYCQSSAVQNAIWRDSSSSALLGSVTLTPGASSGTLNAVKQANGYASAPNQSSSFALTLGPSSNALTYAISGASPATNPSVECFSQPDPSQPAPPPALTPGPVTTLSQPGATYLKGGFWANNNVYQTPASYSESIAVDTSNFPSNTFMYWDFPSQGVTASQFAFPEIVYGQYSNWGGAINPPGPPWPQQLSAIQTLTANFDYLVTGNLGAIDVMFDVFTNSVAAPTSPNQEVHEISFVVCPTPAGRAYMQGLPLQYPFTDSQGNQWTVATGVGGTQILVVPATSMYFGTVDFKGIFDFIVSKNLAASSEWVQGVQLGAVVYSNQASPSMVPPYNGSLLIRNLSYVWQ